MLDATNTVQVDDLEEGEDYHFDLRGGFIRGAFGGFLRERGRVLIVTVIKYRGRAAGDVLSFPLTELRQIRRA